MPWFLVVSLLCIMTDSEAVMASGGDGCGRGCQNGSLCVLHDGGRTTCVLVVCDQQAIQRCVEDWEDFPGSEGLSQCYIASNTSLCSCVAFAYNTGSKCLTVWWLVGPAVGGAVLLIIIFIIAIVTINKRHRAAEGVEEDIDVQLEVDRMRSQTNASMMNFVVFPSKNVSHANLDDADRRSGTEDGHRKVGADDHVSGCVQKEEGAANRGSYENPGCGEHTGTPPLQTEGRKSYHGFELYDNNFQQEPQQLQMNPLYEGSSEAAPYNLYDEVRQFPRQLSADNTVQPYATSFRAIPRPSTIPEEDDTV